MTPTLRRVGAAGEPLILVDGATGDVPALIEMAAALAPFPPVAGGNYPGLRRFIGDEDAPATAYVDGLLEALAPYIGHAFGATSFDLVHASFSMVTTPPHALQPQQRAPHFDSLDPGYLAVLHYLGGTESTGTAFFRQRSTGIDRVDADNVARFVDAAQRESVTASGYICGSNAAFEEIARVEAVPDCLIVYRGAMLHSGLIAADAALDPDPRKGRLTTNIFVQTAKAA